MAYPYDGMFYPTLPEDTQDFPAVLSGVGRSLREIGRSTQYLPYDVLGAPVDIATLVARPFGYQTQTPVGGSDWLIDLARQYGIADKPTGSGTETLTRLAVGVPSPVAVPRAIGAFAQGLERASDITTEQANRAADALVRAVTGNPQATAPQVLQETAMPFMQAVAPRPSGLLETPVKSDLGFYSALEQATIPLQNKGTGSQFLAQIEKTAGVKPEEVKWTGLDEFLKSRQNVTKQEVQDYLAANRVDLQEVRLGGPEAFNQQRLTQLEDEFAGLRQHPIDDPSFGEEKYNEMIRLMNIRDQSTTSDLYRQADQAMKYGQQAQARGDKTTAEGFFRQYELLNTRAEKLDLEDLGMQNPPKFSSYTLPGGENYREILLTLPQKGGDEVKIAEQNMYVLAKQTADLMEEWKGLSEQMPGDPRVVNLYQQLAETRRMRDQAVVDARELRKASEAETYRSSHFDQPNILAHMRVNDRVVDGKKTLFIEEVQSDWHQAGRKKGYQIPKGTLPEGHTVAKELNTDNQPVWVVRDKNGEAVGFGGNKEESLNSLRPTGVPDAPFKTTWHELSLKRAIQEASEKGYDQIAFTTGKTQAERYDLSKQISQIEYKKNNDGTYGLIAIDKQGNSVFSKRNLEENQIEEYVGKEVASKIVSGDGSKFPEGSAASEYTKLSGVDLQVGGEGMKGFYDQILPKSLEKLGKKFDAKVGKTDMDGVEVWKMDITPKMRESVLTKGQPLFAATPAGLGLLGSEEE